MKRPRTLIMGDIIDINGHGYYVAEINTKGNREILELDIVKSSEGQSLTIEIVHNTKTGEDVAQPLLARIPVFFCEQKQCWKMK